MKKFPIIELFGPTIQGEGAMAGSISHFVRLGGCTYRCTWCDSMHAVDPEMVKANARWMDSAQITEELLKLAPPTQVSWVTLTGGDPVQQKHLHELVDILRHTGYYTTIETQGAIWHDWLECVDLVTVSPKPPSSGMHNEANAWDDYVALLSPGRGCVKVPVFTLEDLDWAEEVILNKFAGWSAYISVGTPINPSMTDEDVRRRVLSSYRALSEQILWRGTLPHVRVFPQLHVLMWGTKKGV